jgi:myo-inositol-1(or 4)-monophosphatase
MAPSGEVEAVLGEDWTGLCRRAGRAVAGELRRYATTAERARETGRGEGGDQALVIDRAAEDAVFRELEALGAPVTAISEERGHVQVAGGGPVRVVIDPIDGSLNAKRALPMFGLSIAVSSGPAMEDVEIAYVLNLADGEEWTARRGRGATMNDEPLKPLAGDGELELLGLDSATPYLVAGAAEGIEATGAHRLRALGSIALHLCHVATGRLDAMLSLAACRSVDAAAGQLVVREAGGWVSFPDASEDWLSAGLDLDMRSRVFAARDEVMLDRLVEALSPG